MGADDDRDALNAELRRIFWRQEPEHAIALLDRDGLIVGWCGAAEKMFGASEAQMLGRPIDTVFLPADRAAGQPGYERELARHSGRAEDDRWHLRADGSAIWVSGAVSALRGADGELIGYAKTMRDRTDLRALIETLENRLAGLQQKQETSALLLNTLGHELRNPLAPLASALQLLTRSLAGDAVAAPVRIIERQMAVLARLADDLMDLARLDLGRLQLRFSRFDLRALLQDSVVAFDERARAGERELRSVLPPSPIVIEADRERLQQLVLNLLDNAFKHTGRGQHITVSAMLEGGDVMVRVEDNGAGIAPEVLPRIFELFTQGPGAGAGLGVGLGLARDLAELHGGNIEVRSAGVGKGAAFQLRLPRRALPEPAA